MQTLNSFGDIKVSFDIWLAQNIMWYVNVVILFAIDFVLIIQ